MIDVIESRQWRPSMGVRYCFIYCRTRVVACGEKPCGLPNCYLLAWKKLPSGKAQVYYVRADWKGDGYRSRLTQKRSHPEEQIVCARRLTALPIKRYRNIPNADQKAFAAKFVADSRERWARWAAEHPPTTRLRTRFQRWRESVFGPSRHARSIILASEVFAYEQGFRGPEPRPVNWLHWQHRSPLGYSYLKWGWHFPSAGANQIRAFDRWHEDQRRELIVGFIPVRPDLQAELARPCQRILYLDYSAPDPWEDFGRVPLRDYSNCIVPESVWPGAEFEPFDESKFKQILPERTDKRAFLQAINAWPSDIGPAVEKPEPLPELPAVPPAPQSETAEVIDTYLEGQHAFEVRGNRFAYDPNNNNSRAAALAQAQAAARQENNQ